MDDLAKRFQLLILDSPIENWNSPDVPELFGKMVSLKKSGYDHCYTQGVLPVDTSDFFASHILLCEINADHSFTPVMGYKTISLDDSRKYNQTFPGLALVQNAKMPLHTTAVQNIIAACDENNRKLAYLGSWTKDPHYKPAQGINLKDAFCAFYRLFYREQNISEVVIGGTLRFKTEKLFADLGHRPLTLNNEPLPHIHVAHLVREPVLVMHSAEFNDHATKNAENTWASVWNKRIYVGPQLHQILKIAG